MDKSYTRSSLLCNQTVLKKGQRNKSITINKFKTNTKKHSHKPSTIQSWLIITLKSKQNNQTQNKTILHSKGRINSYNQRQEMQSSITKFLVPLDKGKKKISLIPEIPVKPETTVDNILLSESTNYFLCPYCGSTTQEDHIRKDIRDRKNKGKAQRWLCKKTNKKFINDFSPFNYPLWICYFVCSYLATGMELPAIKNNLEMLAWEKRESIIISTDAICRLLKRIMQLLLAFEMGLEHPIESDVWMIDELSERMSKQKSKYRRFWVITVTADKQRYLLATFICSRRSYKNSLNALKIAKSRAKSDPKIIQCDGLQSHEKAAKRLFPNARVISISKKTNFGFINHLERIHKTMRLGALPKLRRFYSKETLEIYTELDRLDYNFVRVNDNPQKTPAERADVDYGIKNWRDLLCCAVHLQMKKQFIEEQHKMRSV